MYVLCVGWIGVPFAEKCEEVQFVRARLEKRENPRLKLKKQKEGDQKEKEQKQKEQKVRKIEKEKKTPLAGSEEEGLSRNAGPQS